MIKRWFNLSQKEIDQLEDEDFFQKSAEAFFLQETEMENVKIGIMKAVGEIFKG